MAIRTFVVDPFVFAVPQAGDLRSAYVYLNTLIGWCETIGDGECFTCEHSVYAIMDSGLLPTRQRIGRLLQDSGITDYSIVDIMRMVERLTATRPFVRDRLPYRDLVAINEVFQPAGFFGRLVPKASQEFQKSLLLLTLSIGFGLRFDGESKDRDLEDFPVVTSVASDDWPGEIYARGEVQATETIAGIIEEISVSTFGRFKLVVDPSETLAPVVLSEVFDNPVAATAAIFMRLPRELARLPRVEIRMSDDFLPSLRKHNIHRQPSVLQALYLRISLAMVGRLETLRGAKLHAVRTSSAPDARQVERQDGGRLWRCMVTKAGAGYRLHYWQIGNAAIELRDVTTESCV